MAVAALTTSHRESIACKQGERTHADDLLRHTYREGDKVKHRIVANLSHLPSHLLDAIGASLKGVAADPAAMVAQIDRLRHTYGFNDLVVVGDSGMITQTRINDLARAGPTGLPFSGAGQAGLLAARAV